jgi:glutathione S-transferase
MVLGPGPAVSHSTGEADVKLTEPAVVVRRTWTGRSQLRNRRRIFCQGQLFSKRSVVRHHSQISRRATQPWMCGSCFTPADLFVFASSSREAFGLLQSSRVWMNTHGVRHTHAMNEIPNICAIRFSSNRNSHKSNATRWMLLRVI